MSDDLATLTAEILLSLKQLEAQNRNLMEELQAVKEELRSRLVDAGEGWLDTRPAAAALTSAGVRGVSHLRELLYRGVFSVGSEIRNTGTDSKPNWQFNIPRCQSAIAYFYSLPVEQRLVQFPLRSA